MQQPQKLDLQPGAGNLVVEVVRRVLSIDDDALESCRSLRIGALVLLCIILRQCHDQRGHRERNPQVNIVHQVNQSLRPLG